MGSREGLWDEREWWRKELEWRDEHLRKIMEIRLNSLEFTLKFEMKMIWFTTIIAAMEIAILVKLFANGG